ncbi:hypothetical protein SAMN04488570_2870 [Nocardioides scoriae]|uniref:Uncharacterized protein n=1 Tax=Nocardioides scoriae TaxID=642780 RepID=A0A1H1VL17_9ACTN|nr:hypothetical protein [Nocardioides scoriae]SDS85614.1 hypothetical protein SAMN04488570_2870 [Nocardioides scoriae]
MSARPLTRIGTALGAAATAALALAGPAQAASSTISVPGDFNPAYSDTRLSGHYEVQGTGLRVWTRSNTREDKVAEYVNTITPLASTLGGSLSPARVHNVTPASVTTGRLARPSGRSEGATGQ